MLETPNAFRIALGGTICYCIPTSHEAKCVVAQYAQTSIESPAILTADHTATFLLTSHAESIRGLDTNDSDQGRAYDAAGVSEGRC